jgi:tetratricopeptide (TPR) repeat protein
MKLSPRQLFILVPLGVFLVGGALYGLVYGLPAAATDFSSLKARDEVERMRDGKKRMPALAEWARLRRSLERAAASAPDNAQILDDIAFLYAFRALSMDGVAELADLRREMFAEAAGYYRRAAPLRPMFPYTWAQLALADHYADGDEQEMWSAFDKALAYGRNEGSVQLMLAEIAFARWSTLDAKRSAAIAEMVDQAPEALQKPLLEVAERYVVELPGFSR